MSDAFFEQIVLCVVFIAAWVGAAFWAQYSARKAEQRIAAHLHERGENVVS